MQQPIHNNTIKTDKYINSKKIKTELRTTEINQHIDKQFKNIHKNKKEVAQPPTLSSYEITIYQKYQ